MSTIGSTPLFDIGVLSYLILMEGSQLLNIRSPTLLGVCNNEGSYMKR